MDDQQVNTMLSALRDQLREREARHQADKSQAKLLSKPKAVAPPKAVSPAVGASMADGVDSEGGEL